MAIEKSNGVHGKHFHNSMFLEVPLYSRSIYVGRGTGRVRVGCIYNYYYAMFLYYNMSLIICHNTTVEGGVGGWGIVDRVDVSIPR